MKIGMIGIINNLSTRLSSHNTGCDWGFNVAGKSEIATIDKSLIDSYINWNDLKDFK